MKKILFLILFASIALYNPLSAQSLQVYKKIPTTCDVDNCISFDFDSELRIVETSTNPITLYGIDHNIIEAVNAIDFNTNVLSVNDSNLDQKYLMSFYHLHKALKYSENDDLFGAGGLTKIQFNQSFAGAANSPEIQVSKLSSGTNEYMIDYSTNASFNGIAEDAFAIASGLFKAYHVDALNGDATKLPLFEGVDYAIYNYFGYHYMQNSDDNLDTGSKIYEHAGIGSVGLFRWETLEMELTNIAYPGLYGSDDFNNVSPQMQSELLSATLWKLQEVLGDSKVTPLIIGSLSDLNSILAKNQVDAILTLYNNTYDNNLIGQYGFTESDQCRMLDILYEVYGEEFFGKVTYIPSADEGDVYIKDNAADQGVNVDENGNPTEASSGIVHNSPSLWNRHDKDFESVHLAPTPVCFTYEDETNYIHVKLNGNFCDLAAVSKSTELKMQVHFSINGTANWPTKWDKPSYINYPKGDLIGILDFETGEWTDDYGNTTIIDDSYLHLNPSGLTNVEPFITIALPYRVAPFRCWSPIKFGNKATLGFHAIMTSDTFDPLSLSELGANVNTNTKNKNNVALKNTVILPRNYTPTTGVVTVSSTYTPIIITHDPDPDPITPDPDYVLTLAPSDHDPNPEFVNDPNYESLPMVENDYADYGQVIFAMEDALFAAWQAGGSQGHGFIVNSNNEIEVISRDFALEGLPFPGKDLENIVGFNFMSNALVGRTGFDIVQERRNGEEIARVHVEIREELSGIRNQKIDRSEYSDIILYPNPVNGNTLHLDNITQPGSYAIFSVDGKTHAAGRYNKDATALDISGIEKGIYFIRFAKQNGEEETKKIILNN